MAIGPPKDAIAADPVMVFSRGGETLPIDRTDIKNATVATLATDQSHIYVCFMGDSALALARFLRQSSGLATSVSIGGEPQKEIRIDGGLGNGCGVMGPFRTTKARQVRQFLLGEISALPKKPPQPSYCPERDFVDICLRAFTSMEGLEVWARANGWSWQPEPSTGQSTSATIFKPDHVQFSVSELRYSDVSTLYCDSFGLIQKFKPTQAACDGHFPLLQAAIPNPGMGAEKPPPFYGRWQQWIHEDRSWRVFVMASVGEDGAMPFFITEKIKYREQP